jgi:hypothetical protein
VFLRCTSEARRASWPIVGLGQRIGDRPPAAKRGELLLNEVAEFVEDPTGQDR